MKVLDELCHSLRLRILLVVLIVGIIPISLIKYGASHFYEEWAMNNKSIEVQLQCNSISNQLISSNYMFDTSSEKVNAEITQLANIYDGRVRIVDNTLRIIKDTYSLDTGKTIISSEVIKCFQGSTSKKYDDNGRYIEFTVPVINNRGESKQEIIGVILVSVSTNSIKMVISEVTKKLDLMQIVVMVIVLIIAVAFSRSITHPFKKMTDSIAEWGEEVDEEAISKTMTEFTETHLIAESFASLLTKMKNVDKARQEFVSNVSHELKTPLTSMKVLADSLMAMGDAPAELYKEFMTDMSEEIDRENKIINDLLSLVKMDKTEAKPQVQAMSINDLIETILKRLRPIARKRNIELVFESFREVVADVDEVKFTLAVSNLVENAIKYNIENGWVHVSLNADHKDMYIVVSDSGIGIPEDSIGEIFERFYRVDKSHSREIGGTGLGLAITKNAILMHHGTVKVTSKVGEGTTFTVRVPLSYIE
ncbi:MAG: ATP-binding protein [Lachnospiraceae bacterium]|nr:ATP-binding protein [Lachnospiraceae bacterium]